jgi:hypothetical protein
MDFGSVYEKNGKEVLKMILYCFTSEFFWKVRSLNVSILTFEKMDVSFGIDGTGSLDGD